MKILIDMNLSPAWAGWLTTRGHEARHWSDVGAGNASDPELFAWAQQHGYLVFTNDLGFSAILAASRGRAPSVLQVRTQDLTPEAIGPLVLGALEQHRASLETGVLVTVDAGRNRVRLLPLR